MEVINLDDIVVRHWLIPTDLIPVNFEYFDRTHHYFKIENSIHYKAIKTGDFSDYQILIEKTKQKEHSVNSFKHLIDNFHISILEKNPVIFKYNKKLKKFDVQDGVHRLAIIKYKAQKKIESKYFTLWD